MKKKYFLVFCILIFLFNFSCNNMWMNRQVMTMSGLNNSNGGSASSENIEADTDKVKQKLAEAEIKKDELFPAAKFEGWVFYMTAIDTSNVATYKFSDEGEWENKGTYDLYVGKSGGLGAEIGSGQLNNSWYLKYYRYKTRKNRWLDAGEQHFDPELSTENSEAEKRFQFFKFTGDAKFNTKLNNSMLCVDTYTKFVFYYSEPGNIGTVLGNKIPTKWQDYADTNVNVGNNHLMAYTTPFYLYDPIGYVNEDGSVIYYEWAKENVKESNYAPAFNESFTGVATRNPSGQGHSPYMPDSGSTLTAKAKSIKNIDIAGQDQSWITAFGSRKHNVDRGVFNYVLKISAKISTQQKEKRNLRVNKGETKEFDNAEKFKLLNPKENLTLAVELLKHDVGWYGQYEWAIPGKINECPITDNNFKIALQYDDATKTYRNPTIDGALPEYVTCELPANFVLSAGDEAKDFTLKFTVTKPDFHCVGSVEITYELSWK